MKDSPTANPRCIFRSGCERADCTDVCMGLASNRETRSSKPSAKKRVCRNLWCRIMHSMFTTPCIGSDISGWYCRICGKVMR